MPRVFLLIPGSSFRVQAFVQAARNLGIDITVASDERNTLAPLNPGGFLTLDYDNESKAVEAARQFAIRHPLDVVLGVDDQGVVLANRIAEALGLPHNPHDGVAATRNKFAMRTLLRSHNVSQPDFTLLSGAIAPDSLAWATYPCVAKPLSLSGSRGVIRADNQEELLTACTRIRNIVRLQEQSCRDEEVLVEEFIPGQEVAVEGIVVDGVFHQLAMFDKPEPLDGPFFEETLYITPSRHQSDVQEGIAQCTRQTVLALGLIQGPVHAEVRINETGIFLIEIAARSIGGYCSQALRFQSETGIVSLEEILLLNALGKGIRGYQRENEASGVMMLPLPGRGRFVEARGLETARQVKYVEDVLITARPGKEIIPLPEGGMYPGFIFARADSPSQVEDALRKAYRCLTLVVEEQPQRTHAHESISDPMKS